MADFFVRRPIVAMVISIVTVLLGTLIMLKLPTAQYPEIVPPAIRVKTTWTGADAVAIEQGVAAPIEQQMSGVDNMLYMKSTNANDGTMTLEVTFDVETNIDMDNVLTQNRLSQAEASLPADVKQFGVTVKKSTASPLMVFCLTSPTGQYDAEFLGNYATINLRDAFLSVKGVGDVMGLGTADYAMRIWVRPDRLKSLGITIPDVVNAVQKQSTVNPSGQLGAEPSPPGTEFTYAVRSRGRAVSAAEFEEILVRANPDGSQIRVRDVGRVELGSQNYQQIGRLNGKPAGIVAVYQAPGSNALEVAKGCFKVVAEAKKSFPAGIDCITALDTTLPITEGINEIVHTLLEAVVLVLLVVFIFLQSARATLIPLLTVPVSLVGTFIFFPMLGFTLNTLSLFGLILAIGLVVDDAIVVVEAVQHHIEHGLSPKAATLKAMKEVSGPVVGIAVILSSVFVPAAFAPGITGRLNTQFAVTIAVSVLISAFNALTLSPALSALLLKPPKPGGGGLLGKFFRGFNKVFGVITNGYVAVCRVLTKVWPANVAILGAFFVASFFLLKALPTGFIPEEDQGFLFAQVQLPDAASLQRSDVVCRKAEEILMADKAVQYVSTIGGYSLLSGASASYQGMFFISLKPWHERKEESEEAKSVVRRLNKEFAKIPEARVFAFGPPPIMGLGTGSGFSVMVQDKAGGTPQELADATEKFVSALRQNKELQTVTTLFRASVPQMFANVDRDKVMKQGVAIQDVYQCLQALLGGVYVNDFNAFGRQWKVFLQAEPEFRQKPEDINLFGVRNKAGETVALSALMAYESASGPEYTNRFNLFRAAEVTGTSAAGVSSGQAMDIVEKTARATLPAGYGFAWNAMSYQEKAAGGAGGITFLLSFILVFLVLAAMYESWSLPWSVLLTVPVATAGAFAGLIARSMDLNVYGQIGLVMLIGLAAKNAILIVEFAKMEFEKGKPLMDAALEGAKLRLRPILMTSLAFILGCLPLWFASGAGAIGRKMLGTVVVVGMSAATFIAIFLIPSLYWMIERLVGGKKRAAGDPELLAKNMAKAKAELDEALAAEGGGHAAGTHGGAAH